MRNMEAYHTGPSVHRAGESKDNRPRVAVLTTRHTAQDDRIYFKQARSLASHFQVTIVAPDDHLDFDWPPNIEYVSIPRRNGLTGRLFSLVDATRAIRRLEPEYCHFHDFDIILAVPFLKHLTGTRLIYDAHEAYPQQALMSRKIPPGLRRIAAVVVGLAEKTVARMCAHVITADQPTTRSFSSRGISATTVFNYPPLSLFDKTSGKSNQTGKIARGETRIIYQGTVSVDRGLFHMIRALKLIAQKRPKTVLRIVGLSNQDLRDKASELADDLGVASSLEIFGWTPHEAIVDSMRDCAVGLAPLQPEEKYKRNIPIKIFEYMACGLPVIAADLPSIAPYISESGAGVLYDSTRADELARCVIELLDDPERRKRMGEAGLKAVREKWNWGVMESVLLDVYASLEASEAAPR